MTAQLDRSVSKTGILAASLDALILEQQAERHISGNGIPTRLLSVDQQEVTLPRMSGTHLMAMSAEEAMARGLEPETLEAEVVSEPPEPAAEGDVSTDLEDAGSDLPPLEEVSPPPLPPAPRVQTTPETRESNVSLVTQLQNMKDPEATTPVITGSENNTPVVSSAPAPVRMPTTADAVRPRRKLG